MLKKIKVRYTLIQRPGDKNFKDYNISSYESLA